MDMVLRAIGIYIFLLLAMRISGRRTLAEMTLFDFILVLVLSECSQQAIIGDDISIVGGCIAISTLIFADIAMSYIKQFFPRFGDVMEGQPLLLINDGEVLQDRLAQERVGEEDILEAARRLRGIGRLDQIKYAVLERSGGITIIPQDDAFQGR